MALSFGSVISFSYICITLKLKAMKIIETVFKEGMKDIDSFNITYQLSMGKGLIMSLSGSYNIRTNIAHVDFDEEDEWQAKSFGIDLNELDVRIEERDIEII